MSHQPLTVGELRKLLSYVTDDNAKVSLGINNETDYVRYVGITHVNGQTKIFVLGNSVCTDSGGTVLDTEPMLIITDVPFVKTGDSAASAYEDARGNLQAQLENTALRPVRTFLEVEDFKSSFKAMLDKLGAHDDNV